LTFFNECVFIDDSNTTSMMGRKEFIMLVDNEKIPVLGHTHRNVAIRYLMKRRRSLLMTRDHTKVEMLYADLPTHVKVMSKRVSREYDISWERVGTENFQGSRFPFSIDESINTHA
jgi:hypothetical protein